MSQPEAASSIALPQWLEKARREVVVNPIRADPRTDQKNESLLGYSIKTVFEEVILGGQADFTQPWKDLSPAERVLLYAYLNQKGHLLELIEAFRQLLNGQTFNEELILLDLGCGPFTAGLALACHMKDSQTFSYIGVDRAPEMLVLGERIAKESSGKCQFERTCSSTIEAVSWSKPLSWKPIIIVVSYLLASPYLGIETMVGQLNSLLKQISLGPVILLYTNSAREGPNKELTRFANALISIGFSESIDESGAINVSTFSRTRVRQLRYAVYVRQSQSHLDLGAS